MMVHYTVVGGDYALTINRKVLDDSAVIESIHGPGPHKFRVFPPAALSTADCHMAMTMESAIESALEYLSEHSGDGFILWSHYFKPGTYSLEPWGE